MLIIPDMWENYRNENSNKIGKIPKLEKNNHFVKNVKFCKVKMDNNCNCVHRTQMPQLFLSHKIKFFRVDRQMDE